MRPCAKYKTQRRLAQSLALPFVAAAVLAAGGFDMSLEAAEPSIRVQWSPVAGARGYGVQWERADSAQAEKGERTVRETSVDLRLSPGPYRIRVSALNRFGKPGEWSDWTDFKIEDTPVKQTLDLKQAKPPEKQPAEPEKKIPEPPARQSRPISGDRLKRMIPGYVQIESGRNHGWIYPVLLTGLAAYAFDSKRRGDRLASDRWNDPDFFVPVALSPASVSALGPWSVLRRVDQREQYDTFQRHQRVAGYAALLVVAAHSIDVMILDKIRYRSAFVVGDGLVAIRWYF